MRELVGTLQRRMLGSFLLLKQTFLKPRKKNWTNLAILRMICNCCNIFFIDMDLILTCICNLNFSHARKFYNILNLIF
jgi:hypothetical protein